MKIRAWQVELFVQETVDLLVTYFKTNMAPIGCGTQHVWPCSSICLALKIEATWVRPGERLFSIAGKQDLDLLWGWIRCWSNRSWKSLNLFRKIEHDEVIFMHILYQKTCISHDDTFAWKCSQINQTNGLGRQRWYYTGNLCNVWYITLTYGASTCTNDVIRFDVCWVLESGMALAEKLKTFKYIVYIAN